MKNTKCRILDQSDNIIHSQESSKTTNQSNFQILLNNIPNLNRHPIEVYKFTQAMRKWRERSSFSMLWFG